MKVNREQFLAAALVIAATSTGCNLSERMKGSFNASQDPDVVTPTNVDGNPVADPGIGARQPVKVAAPIAPVAKNAKTATPIKASGPASENVAPASENIAPSKEAIAPANENIAPSKEGWGRRRGPSSELAVAPARENVAPAKEGGFSPARESWRRPTGPAAENVKPAPVKPTPKKV